MNGLKISFAVVAFVLVQGIGVIWYVSKLDLENLIADVKELQRDMKKMNQKDKEIVKTNREIQKEHKKLFNLIESGNSRSNYSYGD